MRLTMNDDVRSAEILMFTSLHYLPIKHVATRLVTALLHCKSPGMRDPRAVSDLLKPCDARLMPRYPVNTRINHVANYDEECSKPVQVAEVQNLLFS